MIPNYTTINVTASANENVLPIIYKELQKTGYHSTRFSLKFVGFMLPADTSFKINNNPLRVPSTGMFYSPFASSNDYLPISKLSFDEGLDGIDLWIIY